MKIIENTSIRIIISFILTLLLLGVSRTMSTRKPKVIHQTVGEVEIYHTTVTETKPDKIPSIIVNLEGPKLSEVECILTYHFLGHTKKRIIMNNLGDTLFSAPLPSARIGKKLFYRVDMVRNGVFLASMPEAGQPDYLVKYKGNISPYVLIPHIILMFVSVFLAFLALFYGIDVLRKKDRVKKAAILVLLTFLTAFIGGILIGVEVTRQTFNEGFGGYPFGRDVTDTKTEIYLLFWLVTLILSFKGIMGKPMLISERTFGILIVISFTVNLLAFLVPHSL